MCLWLYTSQAVLTAAVEAGCSRALFKDETLHLAQAWQQLATFQALTLQQDGSILDQQEEKVGYVQLCHQQLLIWPQRLSHKVPGFCSRITATL
jgi:hypothetical protein